MTPSRQDHASVRQESVCSELDGDSIVISGMSGLFPQSRNTTELANILYNKINPVTTQNNRWNMTHPELPSYMGTAPELDRFDAQFFKVHYRLANHMDAMARKILEQAYQAIFDAGITAEQLSGRNIGVFTGCFYSEAEVSTLYDTNSKTGFSLTGTSRTMFANRISYWLNAKGPSMAIDGESCSSLVALERACLAMKRGQCEAAIVGGCHLCWHPQSVLHMGRVVPLSKDGKTKSFDQHADGCAKSEAINVLFLQKAKDAIRVYAEVVHVKTEFNSVLEGDKYGFQRNPKHVISFLRDFYNEANISPNNVKYVEALGCGVKEADKAELEALDEIFCKNRAHPLMVGSVTSNIGYCDAAAGITAITKVLLGYHTGKLAGNLHCDNPRQDVAALRDGRMSIVTEHQGIPRSAYVAVNAASLAGINAHVLLRGYSKPKDITRYKSSIPRLVTVSGRQESCVKKIIDDLKSRPIDPEELSLLHNIHELKTAGHMARGYIVLDKDKDQQTVSLAEKVEYFADMKRPLWFVYSGMGSQWAGMGVDLMRIPIFAAAIERCRRVLEPKGVDIVHIITSPDKTIFDNILHSFVGIAAVQIGLTDVLRELGIVPDKIIGHSVGELGCAYADGCFTAEEMILSSYYRGLVSVQTPFIHGSMAAIGIGYQKIAKLCPAEIEVACHNGPGSSTISGPAAIMKEFVAKLTAQGIFAKEVPCSNIAYHSRYIANAGPKLLELLGQLLKDPKPRSERWVSTSVPMDRWHENNAKYSSAWYHTNNLLSQVLFEETSRLVPSNAVLVEVAPHGLLQAILKRSLHPGCLNIPLTHRGHPDNARFMLDGIGRLYMEGYNMKIKSLYPKIDFPVSNETPFLSHLVEWIHDEKWKVPLNLGADRKTSSICNFVVTVHDDSYNYLKGHSVRGKMLYPFAAALVAVWDTLAMTLGLTKKQLSVQFRDVHLFAQPILHEQRPLEINVALHRGTGRFEVMHKYSKVASGQILIVTDGVLGKTPVVEITEKMDIDAHDVYELLQERDYTYSGDFRSLLKTNMSFTNAQLAWNNNWVTIIDGMLQLNILGQIHDTVSQATHINKITVDVKTHNNSNIQINNKTVIPAYVSKVLGHTRCGGILMETILFENIPPKYDKLALKAIKFIPRFQSNSIDLISTFKVYMQIVSENVNKDAIKIVALLDNDIFNSMKNLLMDIPKVKFQLNEIKSLIEGQESLPGADVVVVKNLSTNKSMCQVLRNTLKRGTFIMNTEDCSDTNLLPTSIFRVLCSDSAGRTRFELGRWRPEQAGTFASTVFIRKPSDLPGLSVTRSNLHPQQKLLVLTTYPAVPGLKDLVKQWRSDSERHLIYLVMNSGNKNIEQIPDLDLAVNVLNNNVWGGEYYVSYKEGAVVEREFTLQITDIGNLDSLQWVEMPKFSEPGLGVTVHYAGINDLDVKRATGMVQFNHDSSFKESFGMDYSGKLDSGERVMGIVPSGATSGRVEVLPDLVWPIPAHWTLEDAATVPSAYAQAFYCLGIRCRLYPGMTVLVHGGAGALGQAAISIALANGCEVFTTVGDIRKKVFLRRLFPNLKDENIGNSRDNTFGDMVLQATQGRGCDIVVSCVKGDLLNTTLNCASYCGITFDTVQAQSEENYTYGMYSMTKQRSYVVIDFTSIFECQEDMKELHAMMSEGIVLGYVRPLSRVTYAPSDVSRAFRLLAASRHRGRVLLRLRDSSVATQPRLTCSSDMCHVVICDNNGVGLQLASRLVSRGARKLHLHCPRISKRMHLKMLTWQKLGVSVDISSEDLNAKAGSIDLIKKSINMGPVEGVYIIVSSITEGKTPGELSSIVSNLDLSSRELCPSLRYFTILTTDDTIGQVTCLARAWNQLPATLLHVYAQHYCDINDQCGISWRSVMNALECAVHSTEPLLLAQSQRETQLSLLQEIAFKADMKLPNNVKENDTLQSLGFDCSKSGTVCVILKNIHNLCLTEDEIPLLTVEKIQELEETLTDFDFRAMEGLGSYFSHVDSNELVASTQIVFMPTLSREASRADEFDTSQTYMCIVPGLEGHHGRFRSMCYRLKMPALVLQPGLDHLLETPKETAERFADILLKKIGIKNNFYIMGYESGVFTALELASVLEAKGLTGTVFCVGGSPEDIQTTINNQLHDFKTEEALRDAVARHMSTLMAKESIPELEAKLRDAMTWQEKVDACVIALRGRVSHSMQYTRLLIEAAYSRIGHVRNYTVKAPELRSKIVVLRSASCLAAPAHSSQPITAYDLPTPLAHAPNDPRCATLINRHLGTDILEAYENKNLCQTYIINAVIFTIRRTLRDEDNV